MMEIINVQMYLVFGDGSHIIINVEQQATQRYYILLLLLLPNGHTLQMISNAKSMPAHTYNGFQSTSNGRIELHNQKLIMKLPPVIGDT